MCKRAAKIWGIDEDAVRWEDGCALPAGPNAGDHEPLPIEKIAAMSSQTGGPIAGHHEVNAEGAGVSFGVHLVDIEVDPETGLTKVLRYTVFQDAGKAIHPSYVEGQMQGGSSQGLGIGLSEEMVYDENGCLITTDFLDYRLLTSQDIPPIEAIIVEVPSEDGPYGARIVGEPSIVSGPAAIANAVSSAIGTRIDEIPITPERVLRALGKLSI